MFEPRRFHPESCIPIVAGLAWLGTQSLRPTFFVLPLLLPLLLWQPVRGAGARARVGLALWASSLLVPAFVIGDQLAPGAIDAATASLPSTVARHL